MTCALREFLTVSTAGGFDHEWPAMRSCSYHCPRGSNRGGRAGKISKFSFSSFESPFGLSSLFPLQERFQANAEEPCSDEVHWVLILSPLRREGMRKQRNLERFAPHSLKLLSVNFKRKVLAEPKNIQKCLEIFLQFPCYPFLNRSFY